MKKVLILLTGSYPYGRGETFVASEIEYLAHAFDELVIISNNTTDEPGYQPPPRAELRRLSYELRPMGKLAIAFAAVYRAPREELRWISRQYKMPITRPILTTVLATWAKGRRVSRVIRALARQYAGARVYVYSYWANDMAVAAAIARERGWVDRALCRAHGWDTYFDRARVGVLPFRHFLATRLDHYRFISDHGLRYFERLMAPHQYPSIGRSYLGTHAVSGESLSAQHPFVLVSCSSLIPLKRVELLAEALSLVATPMTWIHLGDGPSRYAVERACSALPRHVVAELKGHVDQAGVFATYRRRGVSAFISASESEGAPVSMMEALSGGIPVIATDVGGVSELVLHQKNGILLGARPSRQEIAAAIDTLAGLESRDYASYSARAYMTWQDKFDASKNYPAFVREVCE